jgi:iron complex transport system substrate-binding protein
MRLVSLCPSNTELLEYLGLVDCLVGTDDYSDWPKNIESLPKLGPDLSINMDKVEQLNPDLVLASLSVPGMEKNIEELRKRKIPHVVLNPNSLKDIENDIKMVGSLTGTINTAKTLVNKYQEFINLYRGLAKELKNVPEIYWEWWPKPIFSPGGTNWLTEISELAGAQNIFHSRSTPSYQTDWSEVQQLDPDHICLVWVGVKQDKMNPSLIKKRPNSEKMKAIVNNNIHVLEEPLYCRPSPRLLLGLKKLAAILHPTVFPANDGIDPLK